jgi:hypothetical protein
MIVRHAKETAMKKLSLLLFAVFLAACSGLGQSEFERNRQKWQDAGISHYRYDLFIGCFCVFSQDMPLAIEVQDGEIVSMEYQSGKEIDESNREYFRSFATIDRLFSELDADLGGEADKVTVTYDSEYGFPTDMSIDFITEAADDELYLTVSGFEALP